MSSLDLSLALCVAELQQGNGGVSKNEKGVGFRGERVISLKLNTFYFTSLRALLRRWNEISSIFLNSVHLGHRRCCYIILWRNKITISSVGSSYISFLPTFFFLIQFCSYWQVVRSIRLPLMETNYFILNGDFFLENVKGIT